MKVVRPLKAIRLKCYDCSGWSWKEVDKCEYANCSLYPYRYGRKPKGVKYASITPKEYASIIEGRTVVEDGEEERA